MISQICKCTRIDKENDIEFKTAALHKELDGERAHQARLRNDISQLQSQLQEAKNGLMAAARLSDQLELNQLTIDKLNNESKFIILNLKLFLLLTCTYSTFYLLPTSLSLQLPVKKKTFYHHHSFFLPHIHLLHLLQKKNIVTN